MAAINMSLVRKTTYTLAAGTDLILVPFIDTTGWVSGTLLWRVASLSSNANASVTVALRNVMIGPDDPQTTYFAASDLVSITLAAGATASNLLSLSSLGTPIGKYLEAVIRIAGSGTPVVAMSLDVVARDA